MGNPMFYLSYSKKAYILNVCNMVLLKKFLHFYFYMPLLFYHLFLLFYLLLAFCYCFHRSIPMLFHTFSHNKYPPNFHIFSGYNIFLAICVSLLLILSRKTIIVHARVLFLPQYSSHFEYMKYIADKY